MAEQGTSYRPPKAFRMHIEQIEKYPPQREHPTTLVTLLADFEEPQEEN